MLVRALLVAVFLFTAPAAYADPLPSGSAPLPGSTFQGGDGAQDDTPPYLDWQGLQAAGRVVHSPDLSASDTIFTGGSKVLLPGDWDFTTKAGGATPGKVNILDGWSAVDQPAGDTFLYLGFTREDASGTAAITFELNRDARLWNNGHAKIPCRTTGDLLLSTLPHGNDIELVLFRWTTTLADVATGCARTGTVKEVTDLPSGTAQGNVNTSAITSHLPGAYAPGSQIDTGKFSEAALNLSKLIGLAFDDQCLAFASIWMHSRSSISDTSNMDDVVAPVPLSVRTCSASGTKFFDLDADGVRDAGEPGLPRFLIWADYDNDGVRDANEPFSVTDAGGHYVIDDIQPPSGSYRLRETLVNADRRRVVPSGWNCSLPNASTPGGFADGPGGLFGCGWGPLSTATTPNAQGRDFGNWVPASLTVEKQLWPADDPGRFDLIVNGVTVKAAAGDGDTVTFPVPPGTYNVSESAAAGTDPSLYESTVTCRTVTRRRGILRSGTAWNGLVLRAGGHGLCTFTNTRAGAPGIAIEKTGPAIAQAGDTLKYTLFVTNPGDLPLPASGVEVTDTKCDDPPRLTTKNGDASPDTLDPGDTWTYACSHKTAEAGDDCVATAFTNVATGSGTVGGVTVSDDGSITTTIECPDVPPEPPLPDPGPGPQPEPGPTPVPPLPGPSPAPEPPYVPGGPVVPDAGEGGVAGISAANVSCIRRASQLQLTGQRIDQITVKVDGRRIGTRTLRILQRRTTLLTRFFTPGRHLVAVRVKFQRGSATAPVTLTRTVVVCGRPQRTPRVTG
ncbi:DUF7507 domain-containing protein [Solirubrobacter soli]|uniref:DUF7507 domain-containing protein n=1 Tax=Solirubrobacter soli TaxID=363832 RepID=UPI000406930B|nr:hypothetical protein [Solirubrobacter soli]